MRQNQVDKYAPRHCHVGAPWLFLPSLIFVMLTACKWSSDSMATWQVINKQDVLGISKDWSWLCQRKFGFQTMWVRVNRSQFTVYFFLVNGSCQTPCPGHIWHFYVLIFRNQRSELPWICYWSTSNFSSSSSKYLAALEFYIPPVYNKMRWYKVIHNM